LSQFEAESKLQDGSPTYQYPFTSNDIPADLDEGVQFNSPATEAFPMDKPSEENEFPDLSHIHVSVRHRYLTIISKYKRIFRTKLPANGAKLPQFYIHLKPGARFTKQAMRRYGAKVSIYIYEKLQELLEQGLIVPCQAIAAANVVVVQQKDKLRFCIDYRWINDLSENLQYPIPHLRDLLQFLHGKHIFSVLDNKLGYHQLLVDEAVQFLLAFQTQFGMFMWTRCPFGHKTLPPWYNF
jgi:hypothetical protein